MFVHKDQYEEYKRRHDHIWPEMSKELKAHGARNYSIFWMKKRVGYLLIWKWKMKRSMKKWQIQRFAENGGTIWDR